MSWKTEDLPFIAKSSFSSARQLDNSLYHCLMSGLFGFFQNSKMVCLTVYLLRNMPRMHSCGLIGMSSETIWDSVLNTSFTMQHFKQNLYIN